MGGVKYIILDVNNPETHYKMTHFYLINLFIYLVVPGLSCSSQAP